MTSASARFRMEIPSRTDWFSSFPVEDFNHSSSDWAHPFNNNDALALASRRSFLRYLLDEIVRFKGMVLLKRSDSIATAKLVDVFHTNKKFRVMTLYVDNYVEDIFIERYRLVLYDVHVSNIQPHILLPLTYGLVGSFVDIVWLRADDVGWFLREN